MFIDGKYFITLRQVFSAHVHYKCPLFKRYNSFRVRIRILAVEFKRLLRMYPHFRGVH